MKFRFPIVITDEDFRSENTSGLGIRALAQAIESEGFEVLGVTSYGDLSQFAQQQSRASAFILSIDDEEFSGGPDMDPAVLNLRTFIDEVRRKNTDVPIYIYGETKTSRHLPNDILRELHGHIHMFEDTPEFVAHHIIREAKSYLGGVQPPFFKALLDYAEDGSLLLALPGPLRRRRIPEESRRTDVPQFFGENMLRADVCGSGRTRAVARPHRSGRRASAMPRASSMPTIASSSPTAQAPATRWCGTTRWRPATWWWWITTATSPTCTPSS